jgi:hypothetical protein
MENKPTVEQLTAVAATFNANLSPDQAVHRALQLFEAADKLLRADEIAGEREDQDLKNELQRRESVGLGRHAEKITLTEAFLVQQEIANHRKSKPFKTERGFIQAMRDANLVDTVSVYGETDEEWIKSDESGERPTVETRELTSRKAIETLFDARARERKARDSARHWKNKNPAQRKSSRNLARAHTSEKRKKEPGKRRILAKSELRRQKAKLPGKT